MPSARAKNGPVLYNPYPKLEAPARRLFGLKFQIVDSKSAGKFVDAKAQEMQMPSRPRDASGKIKVGFLRVILIITPEGRVQAPAITESSLPEVNKPLLEAMKDWRFTPATVDDEPVSVVGAFDFLSEKPRSMKGIRDGEDAVAIDARGQQHTVANDPDGAAPWMEDIVKRVPFDLPARSDRRINATGYGVYRLTLDLKTGAVTDVSVFRSAHAGNLDRSALAALRQWRWRPGKWRMIDLPVSFNNGGPTSSGGDYSPPQIPQVPRGIVP